MSTAIFVLPAAMFFLASSLLFKASAKAPPSRAMTMRLVGGVAMAAGLVLLVLAFIRLFGG
jgi:uncharacterized protein YjeT (DUF2065 family)